MRTANEIHVAVHDFRNRREVGVCSFIELLTYFVCINQKEILLGSKNVSKVIELEGQPGILRMYCIPFRISYSLGIKLYRFGVEIFQGMFGKIRKKSIQILILILFQL